MFMEYVLIQKSYLVLDRNKALSTNNIKNGRMNYNYKSLRYNRYGEPYHKQMRFLLKLDEGMLIR